MDSEDMVDCGHPECQLARERLFEGPTWKAMIRDGEIQEVSPGVWSTDDPEVAVRAIRAATGNVEALAHDVVLQAQAIAERAARIADQLNPGYLGPLPDHDSGIAQTILAHRQGRVGARKIGRRHFWREVKRWLSFRRTPR
jgi:hypothetical protein